MDILGQALGICGMLCVIIATSKRDDVHLKLWLTLGMTFGSVHFYMLGAYAGALICGFGGVRTLASIWLPPRYIFIMLPFYLLQPFFIPPHHWYEILPLFSGIVTTIGFFMAKGAGMRGYLLTSNFSWLIHNIAVGSIGGTLCELINIYLNTNNRRILKKTEGQTTAA